MQLSAVICTRNPDLTILRRVLGSLKEQTLSKRDWELLIVDNKSDSDVADALDLGWHPSSRVVREEEPGLTRARLRGFRESAGDLVVLVDDDNVLDPSYLAHAVTLASEYGKLGIFGGSIEHDMEGTPPEWLSQFEWDLLGVRPLINARWSNLPWLWETTPIGAGMVLRREVCAAYCKLLQREEVRIDFDRRGTSFVSGGDSDLVMTACKSGFGVGRFPHLRVKHVIGQERTNAAYLAQLAEGIGFSQSMLQRLEGAVPVPQGGALYRGLMRAIDAYGRMRMSAERRCVRSAYLRGQARGMKADLSLGLRIENK